MRGGRLLPIGGGLGVMMPSIADQSSSGTTGDAQNTDDIYLIFESVIQFSIELSKLDLDVTETAMFAAATLIQPGKPNIADSWQGNECRMWRLLHDL